MENLKEELNLFLKRFLRFTNNLNNFLKINIYYSIIFLKILYL